MNRFQGEAELKLGEESYTLVVNWRVLSELETLTGMGFPALLEELKDRLTINLLTKVIWLSLKPKHPDMKFEEAGDIVFGAGMGPALLQWHECFTQAWGHLNEAKPDGPLPLEQLRSIGTG